MNRVLFPHITLWLSLLLPLTFFGFYPSYFSRLSNSMASVFHVHALFMIVWVLTAIAQPILIWKKKAKLHRLIGRLSYFIMPVVFITAYLVVRHVYYNFINTETQKLTGEASPAAFREIRTEAANNIRIGFMYLTWLIIFYMLAIINRKRMLPHATYMFAAILTLLGPTVDRIVYNVYQYAGWKYQFFEEYYVFLFIDILLFGLLWYQRRKGNSGSPATTALIIYVIGQAVYSFLPGTALWPAFIEIIM